MPEKKESAQGPLVLVVDDFETGRQMCAEYFAFRGFRVATAADGFEALDETRRLRPDAILMDLSLPRLDGWETTRRLKADGETAAIPVIALTAHAGSEDHERARAAGCDRVMTKPSPPQELVAAVCEELGLQTTEREPCAAGAGETGAAAP